MPKPKKKLDLRLYLNDVLKAIAKINGYINEYSLEQFISDEKTQDAVMRNLEIIGEAIKLIPISMREKEPEIPWKSYAGIRDIIAHYYFGVDLVSIWDTVKYDLALLKKAISNLILDIK